MPVITLKGTKCTSCGASFDGEDIRRSRGIISCKYCGTTYSIERKSIHGQIVRRRGTAIVETTKGILVIAGKKGLYLLPGGGARRHESRTKAAIRELKEETGLTAKSTKYLFTHHDAPDRRIRNLHKVFLIEAEGNPRSISSESKYIGYWTEGSNLNLSKTTRFLIEKYLSMKTTGGASQI